MNLIPSIFGLAITSLKLLPYIQYANKSNNQSDLKNQLQ